MWIHTLIVTAYIHAQLPTYDTCPQGSLITHIFVHICLSSVGHLSSASFASVNDYFHLPLVLHIPGPILISLHLLVCLCCVHMRQCVAEVGSIYGN